jgi:hypothetical protein
MSGTDGLVPFIDNGGQRAFVERRKKSDILYLWERRLNKDRRQIADRRETLNQRRCNGPERRAVYQSAHLNILEF